MTLLLALALFAQVIDQPVVATIDIGQTIYVTADPVDEFGLGLATSLGRFAATASTIPDATTSGLYDCSWVSPGINATVVDYATGVVWIAPADSEVLTVPHCRMHVTAKMSDVPCFQTNDICDVAAETD